ncbi:hypothetical protein Mapa_013158 [Marchantia paleacea]|nr:hypothetical protein Mapa_013158 [Marchantia paleacea]
MFCWDRTRDYSMKHVDQVQPAHREDPCEDCDKHCQVYHEYIHRGPESRLEFNKAQFVFFFVHEKFEICFNPMSRTTTLAICTFMIPNLDHLLFWALLDPREGRILRP